MTCAVKKYARLICLKRQKSGSSKFVPRYSTLLFCLFEGKRENVRQRSHVSPETHADQADVEYRDVAVKGTFSRVLSSQRRVGT